MVTGEKILFDIILPVEMTAKTFAEWRRYEKDSKEIHRNSFDFKDFDRINNRSSVWHIFATGRVYNGIW